MYRNISTRVIALLAVLTVVTPLYVFGQEEEQAKEKAETTGVLPTVFVPRLSFKYEYAKPEAGNSVQQYVLRGDYPLGRRFLLRADIPFVAADLQGANATGLGDIFLRGLWLAMAQKRFAVALGSSLILNTASEKALGSGKDVAVPVAAAAYSLAPRVWIFAVLQDAISFSGNENREYVHTTSFLPGLYYRGEKGWWLSLQPVVQTNIASDNEVTINSELELGQKLSRQYALALRTGAFFGGTKNEEYLFSGEIRYFFL